MRVRFFLILAVAWTVALVGVAGAADIWRSEHPLYGIILEGTILPGDYEKLRSLIIRDCPARYYNGACTREIFLVSPGGSLTEAMKIGRLLRTLRWGTQIPAVEPADLREKVVAALKLKDPKSNYLCASACFFAFVGGIEREPTVEPGILGIHRPYMSDTDLKTLSANQAMTSASQVRTVVEAYLKEMGVPGKYADLMFSVPKDQVRVIDEADYKADFSGLISELKDWMDARCDKRTDVEKRLDDAFDAKIMRGDKFTAEEETMRRMLGQKLKLQVECEGMVKDKLREDAWKAFQKL